MSGSQISRNIRYLLWRDGVPPDQWVKVLIKRLGWGDAVVRALLRGEPVDLAQIRQLSILFDRTEEQLSLEDLVITESTDILHQNLMFLMQGTPHGLKKELAEKLGVGQNTVSRWLGGKHHPPSDKLDAIARFFGLQVEVDLSSTPLFLSSEPISVIQRKTWLHERLDELSTRELAELYPALKRLLE
jgi:transcriptional regulator with XRE-family HTH domain